MKTMETLLALTILIYIIWIFVSTCFAFGLIVHDKDFFQSISDIYKNTKFGIIGCILAYLLQLLVFPTWWICRIIYIFIYWLFHVGRKETNLTP